MDFVIEHDGQLLPVEVKTTRTPGTKELAGMRAFFEQYGKRVRGGVLLHGGDQTFWIAERVLAAPWWKVI